MNTLPFHSIDFVLLADGGGCSGVNEGLIYAFPIARTHTPRRRGKDNLRSLSLISKFLM